MAFSTSTIQPVAPVESPTSTSVVPDAILTALLMTMYAANHSKKALRKLKYKLLWQGFKMKVKSLFSKKAPAISDRSLMIIIVVLLALILLFAVSWQTAVILLLAGILAALLIRF